MGTAMWAAYRLGPNKSVPAPVDKDTPNAPWHYDRIAQLCDRWARSGYTAVMLPPVCKTTAGSFSGADGYGVYDDYDIGSKNQFYSVPTRFGDRERLLRACAVAAACGLDIYHDMVPHQRIGGNDGTYRYAAATSGVVAGHAEEVGLDHPAYEHHATHWLRKFARHLPFSVVAERLRPHLPKSFTRLSSAGAKASALVGRFPKDKGMFCSGPAKDGWADHDPVAGNPDFGFGDEICRINATAPTPKGYAQANLIRAAEWLMRTTGARGARCDDTKGQNAGATRDWCNAIRAVCGEHCYLVGEFADGNPWNLNAWVNNSIFNADNPGVEGACGAFDFALHYNQIKAMCENPGGYDMRGLHMGGFAGMDSAAAATFVENPDTDTNGFGGVAQRKLLGYFLIATTLGYPYVYMRDWSSDAGCYGLAPEIDNGVWLQATMARGGIVERWADHDLYVYERTGFPGLLCAINNAREGGQWRQQWVQTQFGPNVRLHDFTGHADDLWTNGAGYVNLGVPPSDQRGQSYVAYGRADQSPSVPVTGRAITQTFFGADDLDIAGLARSTTMQVQRIWVAEGSTIALSMSLVDAVGPYGVTMVVSGPDNQTMARSTEPTLRARAQRSGWHTLFAQWAPSARDDRASQPFALSATYTAPRSLTI